MASCFRSFIAVTVASLVACFFPCPHLVSPLFAGDSSRPPVIDFVRVTGGEFLMGDASGAGRPNERPAHAVRVSDFLMGTHEVTVGQFGAFTAETGYLTEAERRGWVLEIDSVMMKWVRREGISWKDPGFAQDDSHPVVWVSLNDADAFVRWLAEKTGRPCRLPTEAEWEYAARAGGGSDRWSGTDDPADLPRFAWYSANSGGRTHQVGGKEPNGLGIHDLSGNVWEWTGDRDAPYPAAGEILVDPGGPPDGAFFILRGGSWRVGEGILRATYRSGYKPDYSHGSIGFRVVIPAPPSLSEAGTGKDTPKGSRLRGTRGGA